MRGARFAVAAVVLAGVVSACSAEEAEPKSLPPVGVASASPMVEPGNSLGTASGAPKTSPSTANPSAEPHGVVPADARDGTARGAAAFARYYLLLLEQALTTADGQYLRRFTDPACTSCSNLLAAIDDAAAAGQRVRGAEFNVSFAEAPPVRHGETVVDVRYARGAGDLLGRNGDVLQTIAREGPFDAQLRLRRAGESWTVTAFRQVQA